MRRESQTQPNGRLQRSRGGYASTPMRSQRINRVDEKARANLDLNDASSHIGNEEKQLPVLPTRLGVLNAISGETLRNGVGNKRLCSTQWRVLWLLLCISTAVVSQARPQTYSESGLRFIPLPTRVPHDSATFVNGDKVSGTVEAITDGKVLFRLDLIGQTAEFPTKNFTGISFAGPPGELKGSVPQAFSDQSRTGSSTLNSERSDAIYLRDGSRLSATIRRLTPGGLEVVVGGGLEAIGASAGGSAAREDDQTPFGPRAFMEPVPEPASTNDYPTVQNSDPSSPPDPALAPKRERTIVIPKSEIAGIGLYRPDDVLLESDFSSREKMRFVPLLGSWSVEKDRLVQASPLPFCRAYVRVVQAGVMRYEWATEISSSSICGIAFCVERSDTRLGDSAYMAMIRGDMLHFYRIIGEARHEGRRDRINSSGPLVRFRIEYDPRSGEIVVWAEGEMLMRLVDPDPLQGGEYVVLHTEGPAAFDDIKVTHLVGGIKGLSPVSDSDTVVLSNGDRVSGQVVGISEKVVLKNLYAPAEMTIDRSNVRSIAFGFSSAGPNVTRTDLPQISLWNGDVIYAEITAMDAYSATLKPSFAPGLVVPRTSLRTIAFVPSRSRLDETDSSSALEHHAIASSSYSATARLKGM